MRGRRRARRRRQSVRVLGAAEVAPRADAGSSRSLGPTGMDVRPSPHLRDRTRRRRQGNRHLAGEWVSSRHQPTPTGSAASRHHRRPTLAAVEGVPDGRHHALRVLAEDDPVGGIEEHDLGCPCRGTADERLDRLPAGTAAVDDQQRAPITDEKRPLAGHGVDRSEVAAGQRS
jgi:hypothetical protein